MGDSIIAKYICLFRIHVLITAQDHPRQNSSFFAVKAGQCFFSDVSGQYRKTQRKGNGRLHHLQPAQGNRHFSADSFNPVRPGSVIGARIPQIYRLFQHPGHPDPMRYQPVRNQVSVFMIRFYKNPHFTTQWLFRLQYGGYTLLLFTETFRPHRAFQHDLLSLQRLPLFLPLLPTVAGCITGKQHKHGTQDAQIPLHIHKRKSLPPSFCTSVFANTGTSGKKAPENGDSREYPKKALPVIPDSHVSQAETEKHYIQPIFKHVSPSVSRKRNEPGPAAGSSRLPRHASDRS